MPVLHIDLLGEREEILSALKVSLLTQVDLLNSNATLTVVQVQCLPKAQECINRWQSIISADSVETQRILFLISPNEYATQDEHPLFLWRCAVDEASKTKRLNLQVIRGNWEGGLLGTLCQNVGYAFAVALKSVSRSLNPKVQPEHSEGDLIGGNLRPIPKTLYNYACEKCSDPECEHALFGFLNSVKTP